MLRMFAANVIARLLTFSTKRVLSLFYLNV